MLMLVGFSLSKGMPERPPIERSGGFPVDVNVNMPQKPIWYAIERADDPTYWRDARTDRIVLMLDIGYTLDSPPIRDLLQRYGATEVVGRSMFPEVLNFYELKLPDGDRAKVLSFIRDAQKVPGVAVAEPSIIHRAAACPPNDTYWSYQWGPYLIWADSAWCHETGDPGIVVAVVDQGVDYNHEDLSGNYAGGYDYVDNDSDPAPDDPSTEHHGTHVAGTIAASLNNSRGIAGMANVRIYSARALDESGSGYLSWIANAILGSSSAPGVRIINMSLGSSSPSSVIQAACDTAWNRGKLLVAASGNDGVYGVSYPAAFPSVIAVGAIGTDGIDIYLASYSNYGPEQELTAPGGDAGTGYCILSTLPGNNYGDIGTGCSWQGTSMATPHVSGVAALVLSRTPTIGNSYLRNILASTAVDLGNSGRDDYYGYGMVCAVCAVTATVGVDEMRASNPYVSFTVNGRHLKALSDLKIYDPAGRLVGQVVKGQGINLKPGAYFVRSEVGTEKVVLF